jgi:hypothetical protein
MIQASSRGQNIAAFETHPIREKSGKAIKADRMALLERTGVNILSFQYIHKSEQPASKDGAPNYMSESRHHYVMLNYLRALIHLNG